ncbi:Uncharacterised protein [Kingella potus]|uniref:Lipoprotein n=1 Tax=Kingella potus TaxID=265175 RepID=A0A377R2R3_9NEIS|nr:hypothetical protein [Kingella potus]STR03042.1 Uncharacterised protein [Kingella potus]STR03067.1 Uncharacterised protein [Kingella potus]
MSLEKITAWAVFAATLALLAISGGCEHPAVQSIERQEIKPAVFAPDPAKENYLRMAEEFAAAQARQKQREAQTEQADKSTIRPPYEPVM